MLSENYFCEDIIPVCRKVDYTLLDPNDYITRVLADKPDIIKDDDYIT